MGIRYKLYRWSRDALDWLFPPTCGGCGAPGVRWCVDCQQETQHVKPPFCERCGQSIKSNQGICDRCKETPSHLTAMRSWAIFEGPLQQALHRIKYKQDIALAEYFARYLMTLLMDQAWSIDLVAPVPIGKKRKKQRGYNQAGLLAKPLALGLDLFYRPRALQRARETRTQVGLTLTQRRQNVKGAFRSSQVLVKGKTVLVIDDVVTSGATLNACADALWRAGANNVYGLTLARVGFSKK